MFINKYKSYLNDIIKIQYLESKQHFKYQKILNKLLFRMFNKKSKFNKVNMGKVTHLYHIKL